MNIETHALHGATPTLQHVGTSFMNNRWLRLAVAVVSTIIGLSCFWPLFVLYAHCTMIDPQLPKFESPKLISHRFLFEEGRLQFIIVSGLLFISSTAMTLTATLLVFPFHRAHSLKAIAVIAGGGGIVSTAAIVAYLLTR